jgi:hypothetical protein
MTTVLMLFQNAFISLRRCQFTNLLSDMESEHVMVSVIGEFVG